MLGYQGQRERWTPLTKIMRLSCPRLGQSWRSTFPKCNGEASLQRNRLRDHS